MPTKRKPKAKSRTRKSAGTSGLKRFQAAVKKATKGVDVRIKKAESSLNKLKREKAAKRKKAISAYKRNSR